MEQARKKKTFVNVIDGEERPSSVGRRARHRRPGDGRGVRDVAQLGRRGRRRRVHRGREGVRDPALDDAVGAAVGCCCASPTWSRGQRPSWPRSSARTPASRSGSRCQRGGRGPRRPGPLLRRRGAGARGTRVGGVPARLHVVGPPRAARAGGAGDAVELPGDDGDLEDGARRWPRGTRSCSSPPTRRRPRRSGWPARRRRCSRRGGQPGLRRPRHRRATGRAPGAADDLDHRFDAGRDRGRDGGRARTSRSTHLELGGKAPVDRLRRRGPGAAVEGIRTGGFFNAGRTARPRPG